VVRTLCAILDRERPRASGSYAAQIAFVKDRPGHDRRYAIDGSKLRAELGWAPAQTFESGLASTVRWYLEHAEWVEEVTSGAYRTWVETNYARRGAA
jgi:dTDP-glucose 4,6-dehydratase